MEDLNSSPFFIVFNNVFEKEHKKENLFGKTLDNGAILNLILLFITYLKREQEGEAGALPLRYRGRSGGDNEESRQVLPNKGMEEEEARSIKTR